MAEGTRFGEIDWSPIGEEREILADVVAEGSLPENVAPEDATAAVLCALTQRISAGEAEQFLNELPAGMRGLLGPCVVHREGAVERFGEAGFFARVGNHLQIGPEEAERVTETVFAAVRARLSGREIRHIESQLPADLKTLWLPPSAHPTPPKAEFTGRDVVEAAPLEPIDIELDHPVTRAIEASAELPEGVTGAGLLSAALCLLSERVTRGDAHHVLELPEELRPLVTGCVSYRSENAGRFGLSEYLRRLGDHLGCDESRAEVLAQSAFRESKAVLPERAVGAIATQLPADLKALWERA